MALADSLEWPLDAVADYIWTGVSPSANDVPGDIAAVDEEALKAIVDGDTTRALQLARNLHVLAKTPEERANAYRRECRVWDILGRYTKALHAIQQALRQVPLPTDLRLVLQVNLANANYVLGELSSAHGVAQSLIDWFAAHPPLSIRTRVTQAFAYYVRGNVARRLIAIEPQEHLRNAYFARADLIVARDLHEHVGEEYNLQDLFGIAKTCHAGVVQSEVELGLRKPLDAIQQLMEGLDSVEDDQKLAGDSLESLGWWGVIGGEIALRHLNGRSLQHTAEVFTSKAMDIADRLGNWAFRERVFSMRHATNKALGNSSGLELEMTIDDEDIRLIAGTMGRFPSFRNIGWDILKSAHVVKENPK